MNKIKKTDKNIKYKGLRGKRHPKYPCLMELTKKDKRELLADMKNMFPQRFGEDL